MSHPQHKEFQDTILPHLTTLKGRALFLERHPARAADLVQDTLERSLRNFHRFEPGTNARQWLTTIMQNLFTDGYRKRSRETGLPANVLEDLQAPEPEQLPRWASITADELNSAVNRLDRHHREILNMKLSRRCSYEEISQALNIPSGTVGTRLLRARKKVKQILAAQAC